MALVERGNVVLTVKDDETAIYLARGYNVVDERGKVLEECVPNDIGALQKAYVTHKETIKHLQAELAALRGSSPDEAADTGGKDTGKTSKAKKA